MPPGQGPGFPSLTVSQHQMSLDAPPGYSPGNEILYTIPGASTPLEAAIDP